jgi:hypothetical protein
MTHDRIVANVQVVWLVRFPPRFQVPGSVLGIPNFCSHSYVSKSPHRIAGRISAKEPLK